MQHHVVVTNRIHDEVLARLQARARVDMNRGLEPWTPEELGRRLHTATAMMGFMTDRIDDALLAQAPQLRIVACALKGYDAYDVDACTRRGVWLSIVPDLLTEPTAELAVGLAIGLARHMRAGDAVVRTPGYAGWRAHLYGTGLRDATVAVVGLGLVGRAIVDRLAGFGCAQILGVDPAARHPAARSVALDEALAVSQFVFLAVPLTPSSRGLIDARRLAHARPGQWLVNVGRGSVVDEEAVAAALQAGHLGGYASDVFACEDWGLPDRPRQVPAALLDAPRTLFTPHLGSAVQDVRLAIEHRAADNLLAVLDGQAPFDRINQPVLVAA
jgi:phosphonate dehydrogenase